MRRPRVRAALRGRQVRSALALGVTAVAMAVTGCMATTPPGGKAAGPTLTTANTDITAKTPNATLPPTTLAPTTTSSSLAVAPPAPLVEGQWTPIGVVVNGVPTLTATLLRGRPGGHPAGVVRINAANTQPVLYAGTAEPGGGGWPNQGAVAAARQTGLVAAFNSGFHTYSAGGGWYDHGRMAVPLRTGAASLVIRADGTATVGMFGRDVSLTPDVVSVRQNLSLLVDGGADASGGSYWGAVLGGGSVTWRSGLGVDAAGNLIYVGGAGLDPSALAEVFVHAGALRAMQLDINPQWVSFSYYRAPGSGADLVPGMSYGPGHWLSGSSRDFFAIFTR